ncbi:DUF1816 domain-containing protein [Nostoc punctiforme]|uniref:DUF1816 domain-containing protein n=1 Tax=Nostoc punctiforme (strain ATCC 29133 / PCC 73102) TaxID=63737 RepID=B2JC04_NOSP7|nr:DUF1816 domain-containing protein [Nostoc punctiforme]ACC85458.1 hypothetical protein Npun_DR040 [Nostoc punctiforme PCC 73102]
MKLTHNLKQEPSEFAWWIEIITNHPNCTYYFGPFISPKEAYWFLPGYIEDLEQEGNQEIRFQILQCQPKELTISKNEWQDSA